MPKSSHELARSWHLWYKNNILKNKIEFRYENCLPSFHPCCWNLMVLTLVRFLLASLFDFSSNWSLLLKYDDCTHVRDFGMCDSIWKFAHKMGTVTAWNNQEYRFFLTKWKSREECTINRCIYLNFFHFWLWFDIWMLTLIMWYQMMWSQQ